jgi:glycosyltransferase involved in cell wall biosynthesis
MRILVINYEFPPLGGGAGNVSAYIARHVASQGAEVVVLTSHFKGLPREEVIDGYAVRRVPVMRRHVYRCSIYEMFSFVANSIVPGWRLAREFRPDLVHVHSGFPTGPLGYWLKIALGIPYIMTLHGGEVPGFLPEEVGVLHRILAPATRVVWDAAASVIAVSEGLRDLSLQAIPSVDIQVIPNGVDCQYFSPPPTCQERDGPVRMLFVGRVVRQKGLSYLLDALATMKGQGTTDWYLKIVGDGPMRPRLEMQAAECGIAEQVEFTGWLPFEQVPVEMRSAHLFVLPSIVEGMPLVLLQAMACGLPVVATQVPGSVDLVHPGRNGLLVPHKNPVALAEALTRLLANESLCHEMRKHSREIALTMDWSEIAGSYYALYQAVLSTSEARAFACGV